ncbi:GNAT family N-acetyltransferase [Psychrobacillus glaciei]|uniref:GNAT family N-acetyltransferase n=1 Tax=Psychrobacillus glaciei TaxID=2283160 RepID=A0A5J6SSS2_9BACI|nr:GNAT family N-acetyltransferase [Psychrobacillus glaciei]QFG00620.1 GNAT family N-acetyltransferase [Psychrobacillus glaciei]
MEKCKLLTRLIKEAYPLDLLLLADPSETLVKKYVDRGQCYIVEQDGETIGVYVLLPTRPETVELVNIAVAEQHQAKGIGKALVLDAIQKAEQQGYKIMEVGTGNSSIGQLALYQKCGFRITGVDKDFFTIHYEEEIVENGIVCVDMIRLGRQL